MILPTGHPSRKPFKGIPWNPTMLDSLIPNFQRHQAVNSLKPGNLVALYCPSNQRCLVGRFGPFPNHGVLKNKGSEKIMWGMCVCVCVVCCFVFVKVCVFLFEGKTPGKNELLLITACFMFPNMSQNIEKLWELYKNLEKKELASAWVFPMRGFRRWSFMMIGCFRCGGWDSWMS